MRGVRTHIFARSLLPAQRLFVDWINLRGAWHDRKCEHSISVALSCEELVSMGRFVLYIILGVNLNVVISST